MKRLLCIILTILTLAMPLCAYAEEGAGGADGGAADSGGVAEMPDASDVLQKDVNNVYAGMDKSYSAGYSPTVANGVATVILPLTATEPLQDNKLRIIPDLGAGGESPFVIKNYEFDVGLAANPVGDGTTAVDSYLVRLDLELAKGRVNGTYTVNIAASGKTVTGADIAQSFPVYVRITDGKSSEPVEVKPETPKPAPKLVLDGYRMNGEPMAGGEFSLTVTILNTNEKQEVRNIDVGISYDTESLYTADGKNTYYIDSIKKGESADITIPFKAHIGVAEGTKTISFTLNYENTSASSFSESGEILLQLKQPLAVKVEMSQFPNETTAGETVPITIQIMNMGRGSIYNARYEIQGDAIKTAVTTFIGNIEGGAAGSKDTSLFVGTLPGDAPYGYTDSTVIITYEDEFGGEYTEELGFSTNILRPVFAVSNDTTEDEQEEKTSQWWVTIVVVAVLLAAVIAAWVIVKQKRKKQYEDG